MSFCVPAPKPGKRPGLLRLLAILQDNPLEAWTAEHFEQPIVRDRLAFMSAAVVSEPQAIQRVLLENAQNYRKDDFLLRILSPALSNGLLTVDGEQWRRQRRAVAPMFTRRAITNYAPPIQQVAGALVRRWISRPDGSVVDFASEATGATLDVLQHTIFSTGIGGSTDEFRTQMRIYFDSIGRIDPFDILAIPAFVPRWTKWRARPAMKFFEDAVKQVIAERQRLLDAGTGCPDDILTLLLEARDPETGQGLSAEELRANIVTLIAAGHETTANALTWSAYLLSQDKTWQNRVAAEAQRVLGGSTAIAVEKLVETRAVIEEALRLYPPIAAISRVAIGPDELAGERIPAGTMVIVAPCVVHRHRTLWERPDEFDPQRFLGANREHVNRYAYLPFGAGPRICLGAAFALQEASILLATIAARFTLELAPGAKPEPLLRITLRPRGGLPMIIRRRRANASARLVASDSAEPERIRMAS
ncbi:MAG TPA: cytochrome P450 [Rhizomicrobium sp.]|jgi:cytochrome P450|nr:cytochrome P450 [Rhizomicrobium sp.]